ncbi:MAG: hypothetical protein HY538_02225 [Deltaproteobacteria bacterium]|nr:hypothetical protein [Deltaproteobacteria bacterium]
MVKFATPRVIFMAISTAALFGCAGRQVGWEGVSEITGGDASERIARADSHWANRLDRAELEKALALYKEAAQGDPENLELLTHLSRAYYFYADSYLQADEEKEAQLAAYNEGARWGEKALALNLEFKKLVDGGTKPEDAFYVLDKPYIGALYWSAANLGKWAKKKGIIAALSLRSQGIKGMQRCLELDETYFYGAPHRWLGAYYSVIPAFAGQDLNKSKEHFERSLEIAPDYFATRVLRSENYSPKMGDQALFESDLRFVLDTHPSVLSDIVPEQTVEQRKAEKLLSEMDDLFF